MPDLTNPDIFADAIKSSIDLESLEKKFMFGMLYLYVEKGNEPFI